MPSDPVVANKEAPSEMRSPVMHVTPFPCDLGTCITCLHCHNRVIKQESSRVPRQCLDNWHHIDIHTTLKQMSRMNNHLLVVVAALCCVCVGGGGRGGGKRDCLAVSKSIPNIPLPSHQREIMAMVPEFLLFLSQQFFSFLGHFLTCSFCNAQNFCRL